MQQYKVIITTPTWNLSGVNTVSANLVRGLVRRGIDARILLTRTDSLPEYHEDLPVPDDITIEILPVTVCRDYWPDHWQALAGYLSNQGPCIYIPNYDFEHSAVCPILPDNVCIIGVVHSDDPEHYEHVYRLGNYWNAIVTVSENLRKNVCTLRPKLCSRVIHIANGVFCPEKVPERVRAPNDPLRIVYTGRLVHYQKRILDLISIVEGMQVQGLPFELVIVGDGPEGGRLKTEWREFIAEGTIKFAGTVSNEEVHDILARSDVFILTSGFEGNPMSLLEAMGQGCVPVVTDLRSGIPELVQDGHNGFRVPIGDTLAFVDRLRRLQKDAGLLDYMSRNAFDRIRDGYTLGDMTEKYIDLFERIITQATHRESPRKIGEILPPPFMRSKLALPFVCMNQLFFKLRLKYILR